LIKGVHLTNFKKNFDRKLIFFLMKKGIHIMNPKKDISPYFFLFDMSSCGKPAIHNDLPKIK